MPEIADWFSARFDNNAIRLQVDAPGATSDAWQATIAWESIIRVCFQAGDLFDPDVVHIYLRTSGPKATLSRSERTVGKPCGLRS
jgi:hypothetical protein